jgi:C1A family cysteine protease
MKLFIVLALAAVAAARSVNIESHETAAHFEVFKAKYGKTYATEDEEARRMSVFADNIAYITKHNAGDSSFTVGVNQFADMTAQEWAEERRKSTMAPNSVRQEVTLPAASQDSVDWRTKGAVTPVKNQGQCGSCWSFSTTGSTEGALAISTGKLVSFSEQQLMDCSVAEGNQGCNGGLMDNAFKYIIKNGGIDTEADYPYTMKDGTCDKAKAAKHVGVITGYTDVPQDNEDQLAAAVAKGPVSVAIEADQQAFQLYKSGVFDAACGTKLDHGVLVVGYTSDYWIVKNSWGATWGSAGFINMKRGVSKAGICGIASQPSYPTAGAPGPSPPTPPAPPSPPTPPTPPAPSGGHYEDPSAKGGQCNTGEQAIRITGLAGDFCSPTCGFLNSCPKAPAGTTAKPQCVLEAGGSSKPTNCALICAPSADGSDGCPDKASCKAIQGTGICTYDSL